MTLTTVYISGYFGAKTEDTKFVHKQQCIVQKAVRKLLDLVLSRRVELIQQNCVLAVIC